jgi:hypothetical protein
MAIGNYGRVLGQMIRESAGQTVKGFGLGLKASAMREMPGLTAIYGMSREIKGRADKLGSSAEVVKEQKVNNVISLEMVRQLRSMNAGIMSQTRLLNFQANAEKTRMQFAEEVEREKALRDDRLLKAMERIGRGSGSRLAANESIFGDRGGENGLLGGLLSGALGAILGRAGLKGVGGIGGRIAGGVAASGVGAVLAKVLGRGLGGGGRPPIGPGGFGGGVAANDPKFARLFGGIGLRGILGGLLRFIPYIGLAYAAYEAFNAVSMLFGSQGTGGGLPGFGRDSMPRWMTDKRRPNVKRLGGTVGTGMSGDILDRIIKAEGGTAGAKNPYSTAFGLGQLTKPTFDGLVRQAKPGSPLYKKTWSDYMKDPGLQREALRELTTQNTTTLTKRGVPINDASVYMAHFLGAGTAASILSQDDNIPIDKVLPQTVIQSNPNVFADDYTAPSGRKVRGAGVKTIGDLKKWAAGKIGMESYESGVKGAKGIAAQLGQPKGRRNPVSVSGSPQSEPPVPVEDKGSIELQKKQLEVARRTEKSVRLQEKASGTTLKRQIARETGRVETKEQKILRQANDRFLRNFENTTQRVISNALYEALVVGAYGRRGARNLVTGQQARGELFRGQQLSNILDLTKGSTKLFSSLFGKDIGRAYGPMFAQLGTAYLEVGSRFVGRSLFSGILGSDAAADQLSGQILGNFARGNKQAATEQLLYGLTGIASGPETIFAKYGFGSSRQGVNYLGDVGSAYLTNQVGGMLPNYGQTASPSVYDPRTGRTVPYGAMPSVSTTMSPTGQANQNIILQAAADKTLRDKLPNIDEGTWANYDAATERYKKAEAEFLAAQSSGADQSASADALARSQVEQQIRTNQLLAAGARGGRGGGTMPGQPMSWLDQMGNMAVDLGVSAISNKLTSGIKNPYVKALANFGISAAITPMLKSAIGLGGATATGTAAATGSFFTAQNIGSIGSSLVTSGGPGFFATTGAALSNAGYTTAGSFMSGVQSGFNTFTGVQAAGVQTGVQAFQVGQFVGEILPYTDAIVRLFKGDIGGAIGSAAGTYAGGKIGFMLGGPVGAVIGSIIGSFIGGSLFGDKPRYPQLIRVVRVRDNNDPNSRATTNSENNPPKEYTDLADAMLTAAFNATKLMETISGKSSSFVYVGIRLHGKDGLYLNLYQVNEDIKYGNPAWSKFIAKLDKSFNGGQAIAAMSDFIKEKFAQGADAATLAKLDTASTLIRQKSVNTLTKDLLRELKPGGKYAIDANVKAGVYADTVAASNLIEAQMNALRTNAPYSPTDSEGNTTGARMIWSMKEGKYVEAPFTTTSVTDGEGNVSTVKTYTPNIIGIDEKGLPIYDTNNNDSADAADIQAHVNQNYPELASVTTTTGTGTAVTVTPTTSGSLLSPASRTGRVSPSMAGMDASTNSAVVNSGNQTDNSMTINNYNTLTSTGDPWRTNSTNTSLPLAA